MGKKVVGAQAPFTMLVPNLTAPTDPSRSAGQILSKAAVDNGTPLAVVTSTARVAYTNQYFPDIPGKGPETLPTSGGTPGTRTRMGLMYGDGGIPFTGAGVVGLMDLTVASNAFTGTTVLHFGQYTAEVGVDFAIGASAADTGDNLAVFIDSFPDWGSAASGTGTIRIAGPIGLTGNEVEIYAAGANPGHFTILTTTGGASEGRMHDAEPHLGPPTLT